MDTITSFPTSLAALLKAEEDDSKNRIRVSRLGWWIDVRRIKGSTLPRTWTTIIWYSMWAAAITVAESFYGKQLGLSNNVTPLLSIVVGLLLVFRNTTAYARWDEGRKSFGSMISIVRSFARNVWINVEEPEESSEKEKQSKIDAIRLMVAFVVSVKHAVRFEYGSDFEDLRAVLPSSFFKKCNTSGYGHDAAIADYSTSSPQRDEFPEPQYHEYNRLSEGGARYDERTPLSRAATSTSHRSTESVVILSNYLSKPSLSLPLIIAHQLGLYLALCKRKGLLEKIGPAGYNAMQQNLNTLTDLFTSIERLSTIGIPTVYGIHLKQCTSLFLFTLPFTLVEIMGWKMIPFVSVCAFTLIGIEGIASEIEFPFGIDSSDLPLDLMTAELRNEIEHMISRLSTKLDD